jgi:hypothetical protein
MFRSIHSTFFFRVYQGHHYELLREYFFHFQTLALLDPEWVRTFVQLIIANTDPGAFC